MNLNSSNWQLLNNGSSDADVPAVAPTKSTTTEVPRMKSRRGARKGTSLKRASQSIQYDPADGVSIFEVQPFHLGMFQGEELEAVQFRFSEFFSAIDVPMRILALSEPYSLQGAVDAANEMVLSTAEAWRRNGLQQYRRFMEELRASTDLHGIKYYLQAWLPEEIPDTTVLGLATSAFMTRVSRVEAHEPFFRGRYAEERDHMSPLSAGEPFMCVLTSWDLRGAWDLVYHPQFAATPFPGWTRYRRLYLPSRSRPRYPHELI